MNNVANSARVASLGLLISLLGCRKEGSRPTWDVDVLAPVLRTTLTLGDLIPDSLLDTDAQGQAILAYRGDLFKLELDTLLIAPDTSFDYRFAIPVPGPLSLPAGLNIFNQQDVQRFDLGDLALRDLVLREGRLRLEIVNRVPSALYGSLTMPRAVFADGSSTIGTEVGAGSAAHPTMAAAIRDLSGARFDLRGPQGNSVNTVETLLGAQLDPNGNGAVVTDQDSLLLRARYEGLVPAYARGYFGQRTVSTGARSEAIAAMANLVSGTLRLAEATLTLRIENGFGADVQARIRRLRAVNTRTGQSVDLQHAFLQGPINLTRAVDLGTGFAPTAWSRTLDPGNSNILDFIATLPDRLDYELDAALNPLGDISNGNDFLYHESTVKARIDLEVPLRLAADGLTLQRSVAPVLPGTAEGHALRSGTLSLFATNGFPLDAQLALDLLDAEGAVLEPIPVEGLVLAGTLGSNGIVSQPRESVMRAHLREEAVTAIHRGARIRVRASFTTANQPATVRFYSHYALELQATLRADYLVNGDE